jgi:hypothetical protein
MNILTQTQGGLQSAYNVIGATGLRALAAAGKIVTGFCLGDGTMVGASLAQGILAFTTSLVSTSPNTTAAAIIAESALINGLTYGFDTTNGMFNNCYLAIACKSVGGNIPYIKDMESHATNPLISLGLTAVDTLVEGVIVFMDQGDAFEFNAGVEINIAELVINPSELSSDF